MSVEKKVAADAETVDQLRAFVEQCDREALPGTTRVHARTKAAWSPLGPRLVRLAAADTTTSKET